MNVEGKQEDFHGIIDQSSITEPDLDSIGAALHVICDPGDVHEVRVPDTNLGVLAGWFDDLEAMAYAILDLTRGYGKYEGRFGFKALSRLPESVFLSLNPVSDDLLALVGNRIRACETATTDHDVVAIKRLYLDGDPWRRKGVSSTDEGHALAISKMREVQGYLSGMGFPGGCLADSGNGAHLIHATLLDNTVDDWALVEAYVKAVSLRFGVPCQHGEKSRPPSPACDDTIIHIDTAVTNPSRIVTAYGTMKRKGTATPKRPHRLSRILESPRRLEVVERGVIQKVVADLMPTNTTTVTMEEPDHGPGEDPYQGFGSINLEDLWVPGADDPLKPVAGFDLRAQLDEMGVLAGEPTIAGVFTYYPVRECPFNPWHKKVKLSQHRSGTITYLCPHNSCQGKKEGFGRKTARDYFTHYGVVIPEKSNKTGDEKPRPEKTSRVALLVKYAMEHCRIVKDAETETVLATFTHHGQRQTRSVHSSAFREWLVAGVSEGGKVVKGSEVSDALLNLSARHSGYVTSYRRVTRIDDAIYIDTMTEGKVVRITADGWEVVADCRVVFESRKDMAPLPLPERGGTVDELRRFVNVTEDDWPLFLACLLDALKGRKPYAITLVNGREGSFKTSFTELCGGLIDPALKAKTKSLPDSLRDLAVMARNRHLISFDNLTHLGPAMSDALCRLSTGSGFAVRGLYKDDEETIFGGANPIIINGIPEIGEKTDFLNRAIRLTLAQQSTKKLKARLEEQFNECRPSILGAIYDLLANGLRHESEVGEEADIRMVETYLWVRACEVGTDLNMSGAFRSNCERVVSEVAFDTILGQSLRDFLRQHHATTQQPAWEGTAEALHAALIDFWNAACGGNRSKQDRYPGNGRTLSSAIEGIATSLGLNGIVVTRQRTNTARLLRLDATEYFRRNTEASEPMHQPEAETDRESFATSLGEGLTGAA